MSDIVERLRRIGTDAYGPAVVVAAREAADEIARLRLTDAEREAIGTAARIAGAVGESEVKAALRAFLQRHVQGGET